MIIHIVFDKTQPDLFMCYPRRYPNKYFDQNNSNYFVTHIMRNRSYIAAVSHYTNQT